MMAAGGIFPYMLGMCPPGGGQRGFESGGGGHVLLPKAAKGRKRAFSGARRNAPPAPPTARVGDAPADGSGRALHVSQRRLFAM